MKMRKLNDSGTGATVNNCSTNKRRVSPESSCPPSPQSSDSNSSNNVSISSTMSSNKVRKTVTGTSLFVLSYKYSNYSFNKCGYVHYRTRSSNFYDASRNTSEDTAWSNGLDDWKCDFVYFVQWSPTRYSWWSLSSTCKFITINSSWLLIWKWLTTYRFWLKSSFWISLFWER